VNLNLSLHGHAPTVDETAFVAPDAVLAGQVVLGPGVGVWFHAVLRGDGDRIVIGAELEPPGRRGRPR
jgi:carbonic anhydrase/acetyltransferase-like protein (isoleucine patch superfamily)